MSNPHAADNLKKRGAAANPNGRPKKEWTWAGLIKEAMEEVEKESGHEIKKLVSKALMRKAIEGDVQAIREIGNRVDGMPPQNLNIGGQADGSAIIVKIQDYGNHHNPTEKTEGSSGD